MLDAIKYVVDDSFDFQQGRALVQSARYTGQMI